MMYKYTRKKQQIETAVNNAMRELFYHVKYEDAIAYARYVKTYTGIDIGVYNCDSASYNCGSFILHRTGLVLQKLILAIMQDFGSGLEFGKRCRELT